MNHPRNLQLIYSSSYHLLLKWEKKKTCHRVNFLNSLICIFKPLQFLTSNLNVVSNDLLSFHCTTLCPSRLISLVGNPLESQEDFIIFILGKEYHYLLQIQICMNRFCQMFFKFGDRWEGRRKKNIKTNRTSFTIHAIIVAY